MRHILQSQWLQLLTDEQKRLVQVSVELYEREFSQPEHKLADYSFVVFSMSKAYEGFLKQKLYEFHLINKNSYEGRRFRIGKALNPDVSEKSRDEYWLFDDLSQMCGEQMARELWDTWLLCRNRVFHYYPTETNTITLETAGSYLLKLSSAIKTFLECQTDLNTKQY
ncbi:MAG: hypothetical protein BroJett025_09800 [Patescibacteria group bacterium]|nr:MAG: hypothetical protein BroJett025_09800 [Patescibacteria group bacterium]